LLLALGAFAYFHSDLPLLGMESKNYTRFINIALLLAFLLVTAEALRLFWTWIRLRSLLTALNLLRLRRTFAKLIPVDARSLWGVSGNVKRVQYTFFLQQLEALLRLRTRLDDFSYPVIADAARCGLVFAQSNHARNPDQPPAISDGPMQMSKKFAAAIVETFDLVLYPRWSQENNSLYIETAAAIEQDTGHNVFAMPLSDDPSVQMAEEFVCFHYTAFVQIILARMRTMVLSMTWLFVAICFAIAFYPFVPRTQISIWMMVNLALIGFTVIYVYAGMERDATLSHITNTKPGNLGLEFWIKTTAFLAGPVIGILATQFPSISDFVLSWLQPGLDSLGGHG